MRIQNMFLLLPALFLVVGCSQCRDSSAQPRASEKLEQPEKPILRISGETMGGHYHVVIALSPIHPEQQPTSTETITTNIERILQEQNHLYSTYQDDSEISRFNLWQEEAPFTASSVFWYAVKQSIEVGQQSQGTFDITLGPLIDVWGFDKSGPKKNVPSDEEQEKAKLCVGLSNLVLLEQQTAIRKKNPCTHINLSGIAAGIAADVVGAWLDAHGLHNYIVDITGDLRIQGNEHGKPWRIAVDSPYQNAGEFVPALGIIEVDAPQGIGLSTSGNYRNFIDVGGERYGHIFDPRRQMPILTDVASVTVLAPNATLADAWTKGAINLGYEGFVLATRTQNLPIEALYVYEDEQRDEKTGLPLFRIEKTVHFPTLLTQVSHLSSPSSLSSLSSLSSPSSSPSSFGAIAP